jgi:pyruvate dehydrogenase E2 component (dihydrolipoamide acetyltransferase)
MATNVIMPALELAQETGKLLRWIKAPGDTVRKGEPIAEIETDKVTIELEAPASGVLSAVTAQEGDVVPVGHTIAQIAAATEAASPLSPLGRGQGEGPKGEGPKGEGPKGEGPVAEAPPGDTRPKASPLARKIAEEHGVDLARVKTASGKIEKADVLAFVESQRVVAAPTNGSAGRLVAASPKARRLAAERGIDLRALKGSGPGGAVLTLDVPEATVPSTTGPLTTGPLTTGPLTLPSPQRGEGYCGEGYFGRVT